MKIIDKILYRVGQEIGWQTDADTLIEKTKSELKQVILALLPEEKEETEREITGYGETVIDGKEWNTYRQEAIERITKEFGES